MKKIVYNNFEVLIKELLVFFTTLLILLFTATAILAEDFFHKVVIADGRAVIIDGDKETAKKRALDDALYLSSIQAGAKVDGFSSVDTNTNLKENLLVRPSSIIKDFVILEEKSDETHYSIKIKAYLIGVNDYINCSKRNNLNISYLKPHYSVSSKLPAWTNNLPFQISRGIFSNLDKIQEINISDSTNYNFNPNGLPSAQAATLDYENLVEGKSKILKNGEFGIHSTIILTRGDGRLTRFTNELMVNINLKIFEGPQYKTVDSLDYSFSLLLGNSTGYKHLDAFYSVPVDKITELLSRSISKLQFRVLDQLRCYPLEAKIQLQNDNLIVPLGTSQGLKNGKVGFVSNSNSNISMQDWVVVTVKQSGKDFSILEILNPANKKEDINGRIIRFIN